MLFAIFGYVLLFFFFVFFVAFFLPKHSCDCRWWSGNLGHDLRVCLGLWSALQSCGATTSFTLWPARTSTQQKYGLPSGQRFGAKSLKRYKAYRKLRESYRERIAFQV